MKKGPLTAQELAQYLSTLLDPHTIEENSFNGIQVANTGSVYSIATGVSASLETIEKAAALGAQVLIVHHGIFRKNDPQRLTGTAYKKIKLLMDHNIALLTYHLPLDAHRELGNNWKAAMDLGLQDLQPFLEFSKILIGVIGTIPPTSFEDLQKKVETYYDKRSAAVKVKDTIQTIAIVSGGADRFIGDAARAGADCYITGRFDEPVYDTAHEEHISFLGLGHYATETIGVKALAQHLQEKCMIPCTFIKTDNPF